MIISCQISSSIFIFWISVLPNSDLFHMLFWTKQKSLLFSMMIQRRFTIELTETKIPASPLWLVSLFFKALNTPACVSDGCLKCQKLDKEIWYCSLGPNRWSTFCLSTTSTYYCGFHAVLIVLYGVVLVSKCFPTSVFVVARIVNSRAVKY